MALLLHPLTSGSDQNGVLPVCVLSKGGSLYKHRSKKFVISLGFVLQGKDSECLNISLVWDGDYGVCAMAKAWIGGSRRYAIAKCEHA